MAAVVLFVLLTELSSGIAGPTPDAGPAHHALGAPHAAPSADTILRSDLDRPPAAVRLGLAARAEEPAVELGLKRIPVGRGFQGRMHPLVEGVRFRLTPPDFRAGVLPRVSPSRRAPAVDADTDLALVAQAWRSRFQGPAGASVFLPPPEPETASPRPAAGADRFVTDYADLALDVTSRMELGGDWSRYEPCDQRFKESCDPDLIPRLTPDLLFGVKVEGSILDRVRVDVDFDQSREFDAANRINIFYEGGEDDILRRLEVGDVTFRLPSSRFLTEGIPSGNFGFQAEGQVGPLDFQTVWAQQRGDVNSREFRLTGLGDQRGFVQEDSLVLDDADYVRGQFFFLVDPTFIDEYPHVDVQALDPGSAPPAVAPGPSPVQLYRFEDNPALRQQVEGFIQADAVAEAGGVRVEESGWFRQLQPGVDYFVHSSGLWIALRTPLRREEMLAVTFITAAGDTVGDYNPERLHNAGVRPRLRLLKASGANHQPGRPTWDLEMHQVYRVSGSADVERASVSLSVSLGEESAGRTFTRTPAGDDVTFLRLFGLDDESPTDAIDPAFVYSPSAELFQDRPPVQGTFIVFPTLRPFAAPPPVRSLALSADEAARILGGDANPRIYEEEDPFERNNAGLFRLNIRYRIQSQGVISTFSLGALGIRDGSERIFLGERPLVRGVDYEIDYDVGQVRLLDPEQLFALSPEAVIRATWEQRSLFQISPTQVFGLRTHLDLGSGAGVDFLGLYQSERSVVTRPQLGTEPAAALLGGVGARLSTNVAWLDRVLEAMPGLRFEGRASFSASGELAFSVPNPNTRGAAFLDDFDAAAQLPVSLWDYDWVLGSAPAFRDGADGVLPPTLDAAAAGRITWQHSWIIESPAGDSVGVHEGYFPRQQIDGQIRVAGSEAREPALLLSLQGPGDGERGWRSVTTSLSTTGLDLTRTEFLEFYATGDEGATLILDLGTVSEDAFFVDSLGNTGGVRAASGERWGLDVLDQEADPRKGEIWSDITDEHGVWVETCRGERGRIYRIGDPRANCTRGNGRQDTEDLDGDGNLDTRERHLRYVVRLDETSPFLARTRAETGTAFQLYRIPIRGPEAVEVGGAVSDADLRAVRHLRITVTGTRRQEVQITRMRLVGSRWIKRAGEGVLDGIIGDTVAAFGRMEVATVSAVTEGGEYASPPGVLEQLVDPTTAFAGQGIEFNEKSLGISFDDVPRGGRAEVYHRFPQRPRNFLTYREARLFVVPRSGDFGPDRPHYFYLKVGTDAENFYLFRTRLRAPASPAGVEPADWLPEVVVDFEEWFELRRRAEESLILSPRGPGDPPVEVWAADSTYAVVLRDRGRAPNLASVRELSLGVWNEGELPLQGEIWVDELRLARAVQDAGVAGSLEAELDGAGVWTTRLSVTDRGALFRQLRDDPSYQTDRTLALASTLRLERWAPAEWGIELPLTFNVDRASQNPHFLANSDLRAARLERLRPTEARQTRIGLAFSKRTRSPDPWVGFLVDGLDARVAYTTAGGSTVTAENRSRTVDAGLNWTRIPLRRTFPLVPSLFRPVLEALLPGFLEASLLDARVRWTPERVALGTSYILQRARVTRFDDILETPADTSAPSTRLPREFLDAVADVRFRPLEALGADLTFRTTRDLLAPEDAVADPFVQDLILRERSAVGGVDLGWETGREIRSRVSFRPRVFGWLRHDLDWTAQYRSDRNATFALERPVGADTLLFLGRNAQGQRDWRATLGIDPGALALEWLGEEDPSESPDVRQLRGVLTAVRPFTAVYEDGITSRFNRDPVDPGFSYQFGFGGTRDFRVLDADTAAFLTDRWAWTLSSGLNLPGGLGVAVGYHRSSGVTLDTRADREIRQRRWPDVRVSLPSVSIGDAFGLQRVSFTSSVTRTTRETLFGGATAQRRFQKDLQLPVDVSLTWLGSLVTSYRATVRRGRGVDPTGDTQHEELTHRVSITAQLAPPGGLAKRLDRPVRFALLAGYAAERDCRATAAVRECVPFIDQLRRSLSLSLDTSIEGFEVGLQMSYDRRRSFVGQRTGSTQFQLGLFGQLRFSAGDLRSSLPM